VTALEPGFSETGYQTARPGLLGVTRRQRPKGDSPRGGDSPQGNFPSRSRYDFGS